MLRDFVEKNHYKFAREAKDWEDAVRMSCECLEADGTVECNYKEEIIACIKKYGPYIIILPDIAMPHSQEGAEGVHKTSIAFMKLENPVSFDPEDPEKDAMLFFTLASCNSDQHLDNMSRLSDMLCNEEVIAELKKAKGPEDLLKIQEQYLD
ncbi:MAG: PTS sugar transporter subunit IIA [Lacrimispora sp.]|uniref:PTS sugar transporter subunit IIA n=1 Tax=Lacrimispora sp. TaxID=2719234 RepID=UPI0039E6FB85